MITWTFTVVFTLAATEKKMSVVQCGREGTHLRACINKKLPEATVSMGKDLLLPAYNKAVDHPHMPQGI